MDVKAQELLESVSTYIDKLLQGVLDTASFFQQYDESRGANHLCSVIDGIEWVMEALMALKMIQEDTINEINGKLAQITEALENQDYILIGDLLEYELLPILQGIKELVDK